MHFQQEGVQGINGGTTCVSENPLILADYNKLKLIVYVYMDRTNQREKRDVSGNKRKSSECVDMFRRSVHCDLEVSQNKADAPSRRCNAGANAGNNDDEKQWGVKGYNKQMG